MQNPFFCCNRAQHLCSPTHIKRFTKLSKPAHYQCKSLMTSRFSKNFRPCRLHFYPLQPPYLRIAPSQKLCRSLYLCHMCRTQWMTNIATMRGCSRARWNSRISVVKCNIRLKQPIICVHTSLLIC